MPEDLYQAVKEYAGEKPFSTTMCDLIRRALAGGIEEVIPSIIPVIPSSLADELSDIRGRLAALEQVREVVPSVQPEFIPEIPEKPAGPGPDLAVLPVAYE